MIDILFDSLLDLLKILPFLFISFILMEMLEHKLKNKNKLLTTKKCGPLIGTTLGIIPQCGFSAIAANLYAARIITLGTLIAVFLSTSDEMIPILLANKVNISTILKILLIKFLIGLLFGLIIDIVYRKKEKNDISNICESEHCHCQESILKSSIIHTLKISTFILIINIILGCLINEEILASSLTNNQIISPIIASLIGLIPNCASSIIITELYIENLLDLGSCIAGLLSGSGLGILILFKQNKNLFENVFITSILILIASLCGIIINLI